MVNYPTAPDPDAGEGGAATPGETVTISRAELDALLARAGGPAADDRAGDRSAPDDRFVAEELAARDRRIAEMERACKAAVRDRELATALAGRPLVSGAATQLLKLWRDDLDVYEEDGGYQVAARDGRSVAQAVGEWLASPEYAHFCLPPSRGGTGARDSSRPAGGGAPQGAPRNLGEAIVVKWREESATRPDSYLRPIGLRRHR